MPPNTQIREIVVRVDAGESSAALKRIAESMGRLNKSTEKTANILKSFQNAFNAVLGASFLGVGISSLTGIADSMQLVGDRIKILTGDQETANIVFSELQKIAASTKQDIVELSTTYSRLAASTKNVGLSAGTLLGVTEVLANSFRLSGSTAEETAGALTQFTQAMSRGTLRGQELNSIIAGNSTLTQAFGEVAKKTGKSIQELAEKGYFTTAKVLEILAANQERINSGAAKLGPTFGQTMTVALNVFKSAVDGVNSSLGLNKGFAAAIDVLLNNIPILVGVLTALAASTIPLLVVAVKSAVLALAPFLIINPYVAALGLLAGAVGYLAATWETSSLKVRVAGLEIVKAVLGVYISSIGVFQKLNGIKLGFFTNLAEGARDSIGVLDKSLKEIDAKLAAFEVKKSGLDTTIVVPTTAPKLGTIKEQITALNLAFEGGGIKIEAYNAKLSKLEVQSLGDRLKGGTISARKFHEELQKLEVEGLRREFDTTKQSAEEFEKALANLKLRQLEDDYARLTISAEEYNRKLLEISNTVSSNTFAAGAESYLKRVGTLAQGVASTVDKAFGHLEDAIFEFTKTGEFNFAKFSQSIIDDINRMIIRTVILGGILRALGLGEAAPAAGAAATAIPKADGGVYAGGELQKFARGGVVNTPTYFANGGAGGTGLMGEAGAEGILPLKRMGDGGLGVMSSGNTTVNIINQSGASIETKETQNEGGDKVIEVLITSSVKKGIASGTYDKQFSDTYGLRRKGN